VFSIGPMEMVVIALVTLVFVGPQKLPELARQFGKFFIQAKRASSDVRSTIDGFMRETEADLIREERQALQKLLDDEAKKIHEETETLAQKYQPSSSGHEDKDLGIEEPPYYDPHLQELDQEENAKHAPEEAKKPE